MEGEAPSRRVNISNLNEINRIFSNKKLKLRYRFLKTFIKKNGMKSLTWENVDDELGLSV